MFWLEMGMFIVVLMTLTSILNFFLRKLLKIEKEKKSFFSYNYVNEAHEKVDRRTRVVWMILALPSIYLVIYQELSVVLYLALFVVLIGMDAFVRAYFEWKYTENPKQSILTIGEMVIMVTVVTAIIYFDFFSFLT